MARAARYAIPAVLSLTLLACPLPNFQIDRPTNHPFVVNYDLIDPPEGQQITATKGCPPTPIEFHIGAAITDPDNDRLFVFWYVGYAQGAGGSLRENSGFDFKLDPCRDPATLNHSALVVEAIVMDRPPRAFTPDGARHTTDDGALVPLSWYVQIIDDGPCCAP